MGARRRAEREADRAAASRAGWAVLRPRDVLPVTWTRAWSATPHRWGEPVHRVLAAFCAPAYGLGLLPPSGWFHRDDRTVVLRLRPYRRPLWWPAMGVFLVYQVTGRTLSELLGEGVLVWFAAIVVYAMLVAVSHHVRSRELTTREERNGWWRVPGDDPADWVLTGVATARDDLGAVMPDVVRLVDARTSPGAVVLAWSPSEQRDAELATGGFATVGRQRGHLVRRSAGPDVAEVVDGPRPGTAGDSSGPPS